MKLLVGHLPFIIVFEDHVEVSRVGLDSSLNLMLFLFFLYSTLYFCDDSSAN